MPTSLESHSELVARRHRLVRDIETMLRELAEVDAKLGKPGRQKLVPNTVKHAAVAAIGGGRELLADILSAVVRDLNRDISKHHLSNCLRELRTQGLILHSGRRWHLAEPGRLGPLSDR